MFLVPRPPERSSELSPRRQLDQAHLKLAQDLLADGRQELVRADTKASILFAIFGVVYSVLAGAILAGDWTP